MPRKKKEVIDTTQVVEEPKKVKNTKTIKKQDKHYEKVNDTKISYYLADRIIFRIDGGEEITKTFATKIRINNDGVVKVTKYADNKWGKVVNVIEGDTDLIYELETINK